MAGERTLEEAGIPVWAGVSSDTQLGRQCGNRKKGEQQKGAHSIEAGPMSLMLPSKPVTHCPNKAL